MELLKSLKEFVIRHGFVSWIRWEQVLLLYAVVIEKNTFVLSDFNESFYWGTCDPQFTYIAQPPGVRGKMRFCSRKSFPATMGQCPRAGCRFLAPGQTSGFRIAPGPSSQLLRCIYYPSYLKVITLSFIQETKPYNEKREKEKKRKRETRNKKQETRNYR